MNGNQSAFPRPEFYEEKLIGCERGLTKREYFAAMAMQGLLAGGNSIQPEGIRRSIVYADRLLAELAATQPAKQGAGHLAATSPEGN